MKKGDEKGTFIIPGDQESGKRKEKGKEKVSGTVGKEKVSGTVVTTGKWFGQRTDHNRFLTPFLSPVVFLADCFGAPERSWVESLEVVHRICLSI